MDKTYLKNLLTLVATALVSLLLILYVFYHLTGLGSNSIKLMTTGVTTARETISVEAYVMREESILHSQTSGSVKYMYANGTKVAKNAEVAEVYQQSGVYKRIIELEEQISVLRQSNTENNIALADTNLLDSSVSDTYYSLMRKLNKGELENALGMRDELLILLNQREIVVKNVDDYNEQIKKLEEQRDKLLEEADESVENVRTLQPGYFYADLDGYEQVFSSSQVDSMDFERYDLMLSSSPNQSRYTSSKGFAVGKLVTNDNWYLACEVSLNDYRAFTSGYSYQVIFPYNGDYELKMTLYRVVTTADSTRVLLIFSSDRLPENFNYLRKQNVEIVKNTYSGYEIPVSAVAVENGCEGVYVLQGSVVKFRTIEPLFQKDGNLIVREKDADMTDTQVIDADGNILKTYAPLGLNEFLIVKGKRLYDGKTVS